MSPSGRRRRRCIERAGRTDYRSGRDPPRLVEQVTGTVRWRESVAYMASTGDPVSFEIGAGKVCRGWSSGSRRAPSAVSVGGRMIWPPRKTRSPPAQTA